MSEIQRYAKFIQWIHSEQGKEAHAWAVAQAFDVQSIGMEKTEALINELWRSHLALKADQLRSNAVAKMPKQALDKFHKENKKLRNAFDNNAIAAAGLPGTDNMIADLDRRIENTKDIDNKLSRRITEIDYPSSGRPRRLEAIVALDAWQTLGAKYGQRRCARDTVTFISNIGALASSERESLEETLYQAIQRMEAERR